MGRECNPIFRENSGLERLPLELAESQSVEEIEGTEIACVRSPPNQHFHAPIPRSKPYQRYPVKTVVNENEEKNEILSRTIGPWRLLRVVVCWAVLAVLLARPMAADAALTHSKRISYQRPNKNCKEFDITSRAYLADLIFEGTARSRSPAHGHHNRYEVTFVLQSILKERSDGLRVSRKQQLRLHFGERGRRRPELEQCSLAKVKSMRLAKANVKTGGTYFVFAYRVNPMNYTALGEPIVSNRRNRKSIEGVVSRKGRQPAVGGLQNVSTGVSTPLRLSCQVRGLPVPRITWSKDGTSLIPSSRTNITYYRKNSTILIHSARLSDAGKYQCKATSMTGVATVTAYVNISNNMVERPVTRPDPDDSNWLELEEKCQVDTYCLNGGQCKFLRTLGEHLCNCAEGFTGNRCQEKDVSRDWFPSKLEDEMLPTLKRLYRRRIRGNSELSEAEYLALVRSLKDNKKFRHMMRLHRARLDGTTAPAISD